MTDKELIQALRSTETRSKRELLNEAAERIERMRWIPVTERLPEDPVKKCIIFVPHTHGNIVDSGRYLGSGGWVLEGWYLTQTSVTHWMPLPEAPEVEIQ